MRRYGASLEVSWDNEGWAPPRPDLAFVEPRGCVHVPAAAVAGTVQLAVRELADVLAGRIDAPRLHRLAEAAQALDLNTATSTARAP